ncbi:MAG: CDP-alcohol phosphatidyltransferase family protein [Bacteroidetes bacterium]|nr:CDP-alcohol phosphatidyltransferase family protein [Bacteroidota bacterium]
MKEFPLLRWNYIHAWIMLITFTACLIIKSLIPLLPAIVLSIALLFLSQRKELEKMNPWGGYANIVTTFRIFILLYLGAFYAHLTLPVIMIFALTALIMDAADGYLARKYNQQSETGAFYDLEADNLYVLIVSFISWNIHLLPYWILIPASMRYIFVITTNVLKLDLSKDRRTRLGPFIALIHFIAVLLPFIAPAQIFILVCAISSGLVVSSFLYSFFLLTK